MTKSHSSVSVIIPNMNGMQWLPACFSSLHKQTLEPTEIILVDNASADSSVSWVRTNYPGTLILELQTNRGFASAINSGIQQARGRYIALLNNDTELSPLWLETLCKTLDESPDDVGGVCGKMVMMDDPSKIENAGDTLAWNGAAEKRGHGRSVDRLDVIDEIFSPCAGGVVFRASFLEDVGFFDESFFAYLEDIDLGLRGRLLGYRYLYQPSATLAHKGHGSQMPSSRYVRLTTANRLRLFAKNMPASLLIKHLPNILYGQLYFLIMQRQPAASLQGYADFLHDWSTTSKNRRLILSRSKLCSKAIDMLLLKRMHQPGLIRALWQKIAT